MSLLDINQELVNVTCSAAKFGPVTRAVPKGTTLKELSELLFPDTFRSYLLAELNGRPMELITEIHDHSRVRFITAAERPGFQVYERSAIFLMMKAIHDVAGPGNLTRVKVDYSLGPALFCRAEGNFELDDSFLLRVYESMKRLSAMAIPIGHRSLLTEDAGDLFHRYGMYKKAKLFRFRRSSHVTINSIKGYEDYYYGHMVPDTSYVRHFALEKIRDGFLLWLPTMEDPENLSFLSYSEKVFDALHSATELAEAMDLDSVAGLNERIASGASGDTILAEEARMEKEIGNIAQQIADSGNIRVVLIAGPSSSGKTTFSNRLCTQLRALGYRPHPVEVDNYFKNREDTPRDEKGEYDFESIDALDLKLLNSDVLKLLAGEKVEMPRFDFRKGTRVYDTPPLTIRENDILVLEGIHCLNPKLSADIPADRKFTIYISCLTQMNVDDHNRIPTSDARLLRRIVRDARVRGYGADETIHRWPSVLRGEKKYIFPYQDSADIVFNSAIIYETAVLKPYAEALLFGIPKYSGEYTEAQRLLKFLDYFLTMPTDMIPVTSIIREFIGGSCYRS